MAYNTYGVKFISNQYIRYAIEGLLLIAFGADRLSSSVLA
jgi:hypothetical protein